MNRKILVFIATHNPKPGISRYNCRSLAAFVLLYLGDLFPPTSVVVVFFVHVLVHCILHITHYTPSCHTPHTSILFTEYPRTPICHTTDLFLHPHYCYCCCCCYYYYYWLLPLPWSRCHSQDRAPDACILCDCLGTTKRLLRWQGNLDWGHRAKIEWRLKCW